MSLRAVVSLIVMTMLAGCADVPGRCDLGLAHEDCPPYGYAHPFPADDTICRAYGLQPGSRDYLQCRIVKQAAQQHTRDSINAQWWRSGL